LKNSTFIQKSKADAKSGSVTQEAGKAPPQLNSKLKQPLSGPGCAKRSTQPVLVLYLPHHCIYYYLIMCWIFQENQFCYPDMPIAKGGKRGIS